MVEPGPHEMQPGSPWTAAARPVIRRASLDPHVEGFFVAPGIKKELCATAGSDRDWLSKSAPTLGTTTISTCGFPARWRALQIQPATVRRRLRQGSRLLVQTLRRTNAAQADEAGQAPKPGDAFRSAACLRRGADR